MQVKPIETDQQGVPKTNGKTSRRWWAIFSAKCQGIEAYAIALVLILLALALRLLMAPVEAGLQYITFFPAVALAAVIGGFGPGLFAALLGLMLATYIFIAPHYALTMSTIENGFWSNLVFLTDSLLVCGAIEAMHRYRNQYALELDESKIAHATLLNSSRHLRQILDHLPSYVALLDREARIQEINQAALRQAGYAYETTLGAYFCDLPCWSYDEKVQNQLQSAIAAVRQGEALRYDVIMAMGEQKIPVDFQLSPVIDEGGEIVGFLACCVDISFRKQAESVAERHKVLIDAAHDGFWLTDSHGNLLEVNQAYANMSGYSLAELQGMPISQLDVMEDAAEVQAHIVNILEQGYDVFETRHRRKDGREYDVEVSVNYMKDSRQLFAFLRDISERKSIQESLRQAKQLTDSIIDNIPAMVSLKRADDLCFERINRTASSLLGVAEEEVVGKSDYQLFPPLQADEANRDDRKALLSKEIVDIPEQLMTTANGEARYFHTRKVALRGEDDLPQYVLSMSWDITERKKAKENLRIAAVAFETQEAIMVTDSDGNILRVNRAFQKITEFSAEDVIGKKPSVLSSGRHGKAFYRNMWRQLQKDGCWAGEIWDRRKSGQIYPKWLTITAVKDAQGETSEYVAIFSDITERKRAEEEIRNLAFYDALTKLPNRRLLQDRIRQALLYSARKKQYGAILFLDMDKFKVLNDTLGHNYGDLLLVDVANRLTFSVRQVDTVARIGGDEFVVLLEDIGRTRGDASQRASLIAEKIREALAVPYHILGHVYHSSPSIGVRLYCGDQEGVEDLLKHADVAMYEAKNAGRNLVRFFDPILQTALEHRVAMEADLRQALAEGQIQLYYQLQFDNEHRPIGAEALIRWQHPERGMVSPAEFIPIAEEGTLILDIGHWVVDQACRQLAEWGKQLRTQQLRLAINVSAHQFRMPNFVESVLAAVNRYGIDASRLKLELTESVILDDVADVVAKMQALKALGVRLSLDDFGTGYSSLAYLKQLPLDQLKIDQSFVRDIASDPSDAVMVKTIIDLAKNFHLDVIAEGVENEAQLRFLEANGCLAYQGYWFAKPLPIEEAERRLTGYSLSR